MRTFHSIPNIAHFFASLDILIVVDLELSARVRRKLADEYPAKFRRSGAKGVKKEETVTRIPFLGSSDLAAFAR
jgi:hypothetical protein